MSTRAAPARSAPRSTVTAWTEVDARPAPAATVSNRIIVLFGQLIINYPNGTATAKNLSNRAAS